ncbi:MAG: chemotaxis protein CheW [Gammaproteobacteria bacterium]|nr:chemotaxis protein CheW [Gammaproteobacteria bacterium]
MSNTSEAYQQLFNYAQRSRHYAKGLPETSINKEYWSGIGFSLQGQNYVAPLYEIAEILKIPHYTSVPGVKKWLKGVANVRGRLLPVLDLIAYLERPVASNIKKRRLLIIEKNSLYSGVIVDEIFGMQHFDTNDFSNTVNEKNLLTRPYITGNYLRDNEIWHIFSPHKLAEDPVFLAVAS